MMRGRQTLRWYSVERMIQTRAQHRRRMAAVFGRAQHHDHIGRLRFVARGLVLDPRRDMDHATAANASSAIAARQSRRPVSSALF